MIFKILFYIYSVFFIVSIGIDIKNIMKQDEIDLVNLYGSYILRSILFFRLLTLY